MSKQDELKKLDLIIKDAENRLKGFTHNIDIITKEVILLEAAEKALEENIAYLKNIKIIAMAQEYKKAKEDLKKTKNRLSQLRFDKTNNEKAYVEVDNFLKLNKEAYDKLTKQGENNVLQGKFGTKRG